MNGTNQRISTMRWYASAIAVVSGGYSLYLSWTAPEMTTAMWVMLALGLVVTIHGVLLLTPFAANIVTVSGALMMTYAVGMLAIQWWIDMGQSDMMMGESMSADPGMIAIAILMLFSGILMERRREMMT